MTRNELDEETRQGQETPTLCPVHPTSALWWNRHDGSWICGRCHRIRSTYTPKSLRIDPQLCRRRRKAPRGRQGTPDPPDECSVVSAPGTFIVTTLQQSHEAGCEAAVGGGRQSERARPVKRLEQVGVLVEVRSVEREGAPMTPKQKLMACRAPGRIRFARWSFQLKPGNPPDPVYFAIESNDASCRCVQDRRMLRRQEEAMNRLQ